RGPVLLVSPYTTLFRSSCFLAARVRCARSRTARATSAPACAGALFPDAQSKLPRGPAPAGSRALPASQRARNACDPPRGTRFAQHPSDTVELLEHSLPLRARAIQQRLQR